MPEGKAIPMGGNNKECLSSFAFVWIKQSSFCCSRALYCVIYDLLVAFPVRVCMHVLFHACVGTGFVDRLEKGFINRYEKSFYMCICLWQRLIDGCLNPITNQLTFNMQIVTDHRGEGSSLALLFILLFTLHIEEKIKVLLTFYMHFTNE